MKGGSLSGWKEKHPNEYAQAISQGIDDRTLITAYKNITKNMSAGEKVSYSSNLLNQDRQTGKKLLDGSNIPESFNKEVLRMIREKRKQEAIKDATEDQGIRLKPQKRRARASTQLQGDTKEPLLMGEPLTQKQRRKIIQKKQKKEEEIKLKKKEAKEKHQQDKQKRNHEILIQLRLMILINNRQNKHFRFS